MAAEEFKLPEDLTWGTFTMMPREEQQKLLTFVTERFRVGTTAIANDLLHVSQHTLYRYIRQRKLDYPKHHGGRVPDALMLDWKEWIASRTAEDAPASSGQVVKSLDGSAQSAAETVGDVVRSMQSLYGKIRVTIAIEPV